MAEQAATDQSMKMDAAKSTAQPRSSSQSISVNNWQKAALVIVRLALAYLFFTQLWWKVPPTFGCPADYSFTTGAVEEGRIRLQRTTGLCDWLGIQSFYAQIGICGCLRRISIIQAGQKFS